MKKLIFIPFIFLNLFLSAQNFYLEQIGQSNSVQPIIADFGNIYASILKFSDIDSDGDLDVLIYDNEKIKLFKNTGHGNYIESKKNLFPSLTSASIEFADIDGDNDDDLLITGPSEDVSMNTKLYKNDGFGNFTELINSNIIGSRNSKIVFADIDKDNDLDLLICGLQNDNNRTIKLYTNNGEGDFTEVENTPFIKNFANNIQLADIDGDSDLDLICYNYTNNRFYINNGNGVFTEMPHSPFNTVRFNSVVFFDIDNDNDLDIITSGNNNNLFLNDGNGIFTFDKVVYSHENIKDYKISLIDINGDQHKDLIITGTSKIEKNTILFIYNNDGFGNITASKELSISNNKVINYLFIDVDGDTDKDMIISDRSLDTGINKTKLLINNTGDHFVEITNTPIPNLASTSLDFGDIDGDGDKDLIASGIVNIEFPFKNITKLYLNKDGAFIEEKNSILNNNNNTSVKFADIDGDDDLDILMSTNHIESDFNIAPKNSFYINNGNGQFQKIFANNIIGLKETIIEFIDVDGDQDLDLFLSGLDKFEQHISKLYVNDGNGNFTEKLENNFEILRNMTFKFADIDNDDDLDILITGKRDNNECVSRLYNNDGNGIFEELDNVSLKGVSNAGIDFGDIDNDGDLDLIIIGFDKKNRNIQLLKNNGIGKFKQESINNLINLHYSNAKFTDFDQDNDLDLIVMGMDSTTRIHSHFYENDGTGYFTLLENISIPGITSGVITIEDYNNDSKKELIISGWAENNQPLTRFYQVNTCSSTNLSVMNLDTILTSSFKNATSYQWLDCNNDHSIIPFANNDKFSPIVDGDYSVEIRTNNCIDTSMCVALYKTEIIDPLDDFKVSFHPNPTSNFVNINFEQTIINLEYTISNIQGQIITQQRLNNINQAKIQLDNSPGVYFLTLKSDTETKTIKLIKQ